MLWFINTSGLISNPIADKELLTFSKEKHLTYLDVKDNKKIACLNQICLDHQQKLG